jgi:hypothetical protein
VIEDLVGFFLLLGFLSLFVVFFLCHRTLGKLRRRVLAEIPEARDRATVLDDGYKIVNCTEDGTLCGRPLSAEAMALRRKAVRLFYASTWLFFVLLFAFLASYFVYEN